MNRKISVVLYGAGNRCRRLLDNIPDSNIKIIAIVDNDSNKCGLKINGHPILSINELKKINAEYFCITVVDHEVKTTATNIFLDNGYVVEKEIEYNELVYRIIKSNSNISIYDQHKSINNIVFECPNGLILGGVEAWVVDLTKEIEASTQYVPMISSPIIEEEFYHSSNILYYDKDWSIWREIFNIEATIEKVLPCIVVLCTINNTARAAFYLKNIYGNQVKIISVVHNDIESNYVSNKMADDYVDLYIAVSLKIKQNLIRAGIYHKKVISMCCPFHCETELEKKYTIDVNKPIMIGYAGRLDGFEKSQKRMDIILRLLTELRNMGINYQCNIAGDGLAKNIMIEYVNDNNLNDYVNFCGNLPRNRIPMFWKNQDVCINMADYEGRSISIIEAMGNGVVPIVTDVSGVRDDIIDGDNGFIVPLRDYKLAAKHVKYLFYNRTSLKKMGKKAHEAVLSKSSMEKHLEFWKDILCKLNNNVL